MCVEEQRILVMYQQLEIAATIDVTAAAADTLPQRMLPACRSRVSTYKHSNNIALVVIALDRS
jgi:hypothetical protein